MIDLMSATRGAVFQALSAAVTDTPVFDDLPQNTQPPFIKVGTIDSDYTGGKLEQAERLTLEIITVYRGSDRGVLLGMMHLARAALDRQPIEADGVAFQPPRFTKATASDAADDGVTFAGLSYFIIDAEPARPEKGNSMSSQYGQTWRIQVGDGQTTEAFVTIGGEVSFDWERSSKEIDLSSKDDGAYAAAGFGSQSVTITPNGKLKLPDVGLSRLITASKAIPPVVDVEITNGAIVAFKGQVAVGNFSTTHPNDDVCTWKCTLKATQAPTIDNLAATS